MKKIIVGERRGDRAEQARAEAEQAGRGHHRHEIEKIDRCVAPARRDQQAGSGRCGDHEQRLRIGAQRLGRGSCGRTAFHALQLNPNAGRVEGGAGDPYENLMRRADFRMEWHGPSRATAKS